ncbi:hypothetical protein [Desulfurella sp.]|uniref:hypothetical protein n=1 Tax=Desulfurella sp. TaxID=1962857 RepID=UPI0025BEC562|nr:hypothetical protein [Desulfurella sp.]
MEQEQDKIVDLIHALAYQRANSAGLLGDTAKTPEEIGVIGAASAHTSRIISDFASGKITVEEAKENLRNTFDSTVESLIRKGYDLLHTGIVKITRAYFGPVVSTIAHVGLSLVKEKVVKIVKNIASGIWNMVKGFFKLSL